ncbi:stage II sporulation protein M [Luxibacter massiliensis]|uniref:stage II sporulation protein M n=1 Tax=Luxibacter massiliensis TaxID=2219695 RepID=UPI000F068CE7|nr:stage II sporulation protein M [Luxibacter massiliensis]
MKILHTRKQLFVFFMPGFLLGILYVNLIMKKYTAEPGIFSDYFLKQYEAAEIVAEEYIWYLLRVRAVPFLVLLGLAFTRIRKVSSVAFLVWTGFSSGMLLSMAVLGMGIKGSILCVVGIFPQFLLYIPAYMVVIWYSYTYPQNRWNTQKSIFVALTMLTGLILEVYVNPLLMQAFLSTL